MNRPEQAIHRAVVQHLEARAAPGVFWTHPASGEARDRTTAGILKGLGVRKGWPDLIGFVPAEPLLRIWGLEIKGPQGRLTAEQREWIARVSGGGHLAGWASSLDDALGLLEGWGVLRGRAS